MTEPDAGALVGRVLAEHGVRHVFSVNGGHVFPILANLREHGIGLVHVRHEQAAAYAADGWARTTATPGVCLVTAGCGLTNAVTGLAVAGLTNSAVVCLSGQHPAAEDGLGSFQEAYGSEICGSFAKFTKRVLDPDSLRLHLHRAFAEAASPPQGVSLVEIPADVMYAEVDESTQRAGGSVAEFPGASADPAVVDRVLELLQRAQRPLLVGGDGVFWSGASEQLRAFAELAAVPVYTRRAGQGAVPEDHELTVRGAWKKPFTSRADLVIAVGFRFWSGERFGQPPTWPEHATHVQVDPTPSRIGLNVPADVGIAADPKTVLRQLTDRARELGVDLAAGRDPSWLPEVAEARKRFDEMTAARAAEHRDAVPIHPDRLLSDVAATVDDDASIIVDSFTLSGYVSHWIRARFAGQIVDAGPLAPVGHSIGMALGVQLARPGKQVVAVIGDGGMGIGGFDMETAARYRLPVVAVLWNNSSWGPSFDQMPSLKGRVDPFDMLPDIRYDRIFAELGCHGERVEKPDEIVPALERALASGKPAVVDVIGDRHVGHPTLGGSLLGSTQI